MRVGHTLTARRSVGHDHTARRRSITCGFEAIKVRNTGGLQYRSQLSKDFGTPLTPLIEPPLSVPTPKQEPLIPIRAASPPLLPDALMFVLCGLAVVPKYEVHSRCMILCGTVVSVTLFSRVRHRRIHLCRTRLPLSAG